MSRDLTKFVLQTPFSTHTAQVVNKDLWKVVKTSKVKRSMNYLYSKLYDERPKVNTILNSTPSVLWVIKSN